MSISFWFEGDTDHMEKVDCYCVIYGEEAPKDCPECHGSGMEIYIVQDHTVNLSNGRAWRMMGEVVGLDNMDHCGSIPGVEFWKLLLQASRKIELPRFSELFALAEIARNQDKVIHWG